MTSNLKLGDIAFFNAEHPKHRVQNLKSGSGKWTAPPKHTGDLICEFTFSSPSLITRLDIGNFWSASVEVQLGLSSWPHSQRESLISHIFMNRLSSVSGESKEDLVAFTAEKFQNVSEKYWDRIRIICRQPYRFQNDCFGLSMFMVSGTPKFKASAEKVIQKHKVVENGLKAFMEKKLQNLPKSKPKGSFADLLTPNKKLSLMKDSLMGSKSSPILKEPAKPSSDTKSLRFPFSDTKSYFAPSTSSGEMSKSSDKINNGDKTRDKGVSSSSLSSLELSREKENVSNADFSIKARSFLHSCRFQDKDLDELQTVTFNNVKTIWVEKHKRQLTKEEKSILKTLSRQFIGDLVEQKEVAAVTFKSKTIKDLNDTSTKKRKKDRESGEKESFGGFSRNAVALADVDLSESKDISPEKEKRPEKRRKLNQDNMNLNQDKKNMNQDNMNLNQDKKNLNQDKWYRSAEKKLQNKPNCDKIYSVERLAEVPRDKLLEAGVLVQEYNYKKDKDLPLKGGRVLKVVKTLPVTFYKVGPHIHLVYKTKFYNPDVQPEHRCRLFKDFDEKKVQEDHLPAKAVRLLRSSGDVQSGSEDGKAVESAVPTFDLDLDDSIVVEDDVLHQKEAKVEPEEAKVEPDAVSGDCPLCSKSFHLDILQEHASTCDGDVEDVSVVTISSSRLKVEKALTSCPLCGVEMEPGLLATHAATCGSEPSSRESSRPTTPAVTAQGVRNSRFGECPVCERLLPLVDLTEHASACQGLSLNGGNGLHVNVMDSQSKCDFCEKLVPDFVMEEHVDQCEARGVRTRVVSNIERRNSMKRNRNF